MSAQAQREIWPAKTAQPTAQREMFSRMDADLFLANQLFRHGLSAGVLDGVSLPAERRERIRRTILAAELEENFVKGGPRDAAPETIAQAFQRLYGEPLVK